MGISEMDFLFLKSFHVVINSIVFGGEGVDSIHPCTFLIFLKRLRLSKNVLDICWTLFKIIFPYFFPMIWDRFCDTHCSGSKWKTLYFEFFLLLLDPMIKKLSLFSIYDDYICLKMIHKKLTLGRKGGGKRP